MVSILRNELIEVKTNFANERRTIFLEGSDEQDDEDLIQKEDMVITVKSALATSKEFLFLLTELREGVGKVELACKTREEDFCHKSFFCEYSHFRTVFFSNNGKSI